MAHHRIPAILAGVLSLIVACGGAAPAATATTAPAAPGATATTAPAAPGATATRAPAAAVATATAVSAPAKVAPQGKAFYAQVTDVGANDPQGVTSGVDTIYWKTLFGTLLEYDLGGKLVAGLATSWRYVDPTTVEFKLRQGVRWHNGDTFTSKDVAFTVERGKSEYVTKRGGPPSGGMAKIDTVQTPDAYTVVFKIKQADSYFLTQIGEPISGSKWVPQDYIKKVGDEGFDAAVVGNGPYKFASRIKGEVLRLTYFDGWWGPLPFDPAPTVKDWEIRFVPETEARIASLRTGQFDVIESVPPQQVAALEKDARVSEVIKLPAAQVIALMFHNKAATIPGTDVPNPFLNVKVRQALYMAVDLETIRTKVLLGVPPQSVGPWPSFMPGGHPEQITPWAYDPQKARQILEAEKFPFERDWDFWHYAATSGSPEAMEAVMEFWRRVGVKSVNRNTEVGTLVQMWRTAGTYPFQMGRQNGRGTDIGGYMDVFITCKGSLSVICDPEFDKIIDRYKAAFDPAERDRVGTEAYKRAHEQASWIPVFVGVQIFATGPRIKWTLPKGILEPYGLERAVWRSGYPR